MPFRFLAGLALFLIGLLFLGFGWLSPGPPRINVRWTQQTTFEVRATLERELRLMAPVHVEDSTWSYQLLDTSREHVDQILDHPAVEDRHYISLDRTLTPEAPPLRAWFMARYGRPPVSWIAASWWLLGPLCCAASLLVGWPYLRLWAAAADPRLAAIVVASAGLRVWLILAGGQYYWPDESRYRGARVLLAALFGDRTALHDTLAEPTALLLETMGAVPASVETLIGANPHIPALFFGTCSVVSIWLVAAIARRLGASRDESFFAALLVAGSTALFYMSRHLTGYDLALMCGLFAVFVGVCRPSSPRASVLTGVWAVAAFLAYAGAWPLGGAACAIHMADAPTVREGIRRGAFAAVGIASVVVTLMLAYAAMGLSWIQQLSNFAGLITQGEFSEGWYLPFAYLWYAEHLMSIGWLAALAWCLWRFRWTVQTRLTRAGLIGAISVYTALAVSSTLLHRFVVYGRLSRPLVPFLCLIGAAALGMLVNQAEPIRRRTVTALIVFGVAVQAGFNFSGPLRIVYPAEFIARVEREYPEPRVFVNARHLYPGPEPIEIPAGYHEVASAAHPLEFLPYQYEGYAEHERRLLRQSDLRMRAFVPAK